MAGPLEGILVVALEQAVAAPFASSRLADAGARVIKLERSEGDFARGYDGFVHGQSSYFVWNNRGKESCTVDLKKPDDLALVERMLERADVFIQNLAAGATHRLGIGSADLRRRFPRLIVCDIVGFASGTPDHDRKAYDLLIQAEAGLAAVTGSVASGATRVGISISDISTGQAAYAAILQALYSREHSVAGSHIELSLFDTIAEYMNVPYLARQYGGSEPPRLGLAHPSIAPYGVFRARDGEILISIQNEREWATFCEGVLGDPALSTDARFATNKERCANRTALDDKVQQIVGPQSVADLVDRLDRLRIAYGRVSTMAQLAAHRSVAKVPVETPAGSADLIAPPTIVDGRRPTLGRVPALGEHDAAIRAEFAPVAVSGQAHGEANAT
ncbi:CoA transferase [Pseudaminobacter sp. 19-2017]|uniref:CoA transferase n=1 Tax=Pseudaminobacter soli (ex Zhang et al. 2022) TaxID=2831468 RepID=A0A942E1U6_9HYPH|nr:CaiB/BaiF CoA-transferase family protein [Pseudaminobacter soli]MBS3649481.1 CoA transferase [Pseudaminobacter soli]